MKECIFKVVDKELGRKVIVKDRVNGYQAHHINNCNHSFTRGKVAVMIFINGNDIKFVKLHNDKGHLDFDYDFIRKFFDFKKLK